MPTVAQRAAELQLLALPGARLRFIGRELQMTAGIAPGVFGRVYDCLLRVYPGAVSPDVIVVKPDLNILARGEKIPHIYPYRGQGTRLCLWWPKGREWVPQMKLSDTFILWTAEWLYYFELWLQSGEWSGGGEHPVVSPRRWARPGLQ